MLVLPLKEMDAYVKIIFQSGMVTQACHCIGQGAEKEGPEIQSQSGYTMNSCLQKEKVDAVDVHRAHSLIPNSTTLAKCYTSSST